MTRGFGGGLAGLRYRRLISFLRRNQLHATAHAYVRPISWPQTACDLALPYSNLCRLERQTGVFFDAAHLRRMLLDGRYVPASSYARRFVTVRDCSPEADKLNFLILLLRVIADCAGAGPTTEDDLFRRIYSSLGAHSRCHAIRKLLLSMRSDCIKYHFTLLFYLGNLRSIT
jgi:hypothetical protein